MPQKAHLNLALGTTSVFVIAPASFYYGLCAVSDHSYFNAAAFTLISLAAFSYGGSFAYDGAMELSKGGIQTKKKAAVPNGNGSTQEEPSQPSNGKPEQQTSLNGTSASPVRIHEGYYCALSN